MRASRALENPTLVTAWLLRAVSIDREVLAASPALLVHAPQQAQLLRRKSPIAYGDQSCRRSQRRCISHPGGCPHPAHARSGCNMLTRLPSVSKNETYRPTPGICIGSPRTLPPSFPTRRIADSMSSTPMTIDGYCAGQSGFFGKNPPLMAPAGAPGFTSDSAVVTST